jgi:hypothetical protein
LANIDPTDEDSWTFATNGTTPKVYYQVFDENGAAAGNTATDDLRNVAITGGSAGNQLSSSST